MNTHQKVEINYYSRQSQRKKHGHEISMFRYHGMFQYTQLVNGCILTSLNQLLGRTHL